MSKKKYCSKIGCSNQRANWNDGLCEKHHNAEMLPYTKVVWAASDTLTSHQAESLFGR